MEDNAQEQTPATSPATSPPPSQYSFYIHPLRKLFQSLWHDLSLGAYPTVPPPLRSLCHTARQHVYSISQNTENLMVAVPHLLQLVNLIQKENIDAKLLEWHELRSHEKLQAYLERVDGVALNVPEYPVEARIYILVGYLLGAENGKKARWGSIRGVGWTAVALASNYRQVEILRHLLQKGAIPIVTNRVFTGLLVVDDIRRKRLQRFLKGDLDDLNEIVYRHRIDDASLEILRLLMHHGFKPLEEQRWQGQTHSDPRVRYLFHDPQTNKGVKRTGKNHDTDADVSQETLEDDFPPICPDKEASVVTENSLWNDAKMHELKRSFAPGSKPSLDLTMRHPFSKIDVLSEKHTLAGEHTHAENRTPATSDPFPPLRPVPHENENALESRNHVPIRMEAKNAHEDPLNNWKTFRENITAPETSHKSSRPSMSNDKRKKKKGKWTALEL
ncbi:hypothetical protein GRF29_161g1488338 [Pseudopithomyces chartarum]|uniref:Ankyrin repeat protein n=1 Tax=Pseudopithomyces chartarum TaxID=1892770 RepID=A0AAN6REL3_9PLEO|nr:hypothetical protein GRF29_161g1488338 [Pseudopithomyces chartarum]